MLLEVFLDFHLRATLRSLAAVLSFSLTQELHRRLRLLVKGLISPSVRWLDMLAALELDPLRIGILPFVNYKPGEDPYNPPTAFTDPRFLEHFLGDLNEVAVGEISFYETPKLRENLLEPFDQQKSSVSDDPALKMLLFCRKPGYRAPFMALAARLSDQRKTATKCRELMTAIDEIVLERVGDGDDSKYYELRPTHMAPSSVWIDTEYAPPPETAQHPFKCPFGEVPHGVELALPDPHGPRDGLAQSIHPHNDQGVADGAV